MSEGKICAAGMAGPAQHGKQYISHHELENYRELHPYLSIANPDTKAHMLLFYQWLARCGKGSGIQ